MFLLNYAYIFNIESEFLSSLYTLFFTTFTYNIHISNTTDKSSILSNLIIFQLLITIYKNIGTRILNIK